MLPVIFLAVCAAGFLFMIVRVQRQVGRLQPLRDRAALERVTFQCAVRARVKRKGAVGFTTLKGAGLGAELRIHATVLVVELAGPMQRQARRLGTEVILETAGSSMTRRAIGWLGTPLAARDCILINGRESGARVAVALDAYGRVEEAWSALAAAGVRRAVEQ